MSQTCAVGLTTETAATATTTEFATFAAATTAAAAAAAETAATAAGTIFAGTRFIDGEGATVEFFAVEIGNGFGRFFLRAHGDEGETAGLAREFVHDQFARCDIAGLFEEVQNVAFGGVKRQVAYE